MTTRLEATMRTTLTRALLAGLVLAVGLVMPGPVTASAAKAPTKTRAIDKLKYPPMKDIKIPTVIRETLPNGIKLFLVEDHQLPRVGIRATVRGGRIVQPTTKAGLSELFGEVERTGGTKNMTGDQIDAFLETLGASVESGVGEAAFEVSGQALTETLDKVLPVFADVLTAPVFAQEKIDLAKTHLRGAISRRNDQVFEIMRRETAKLVYGAKSPYAWQFEYDDIESLTREDLLAFHARFFRPDATIVAVWGDFRAPEMKARLEKLLGDWKGQGPAPAVQAPVVPPTAPSVNYIEKKDVEQTFITAGRLGVRLNDADYPAINIMSDILGGGFASRIFVKVRTEKGLAYGAGGYMVPAFDHSGVFFFYTSTKPSTTAEALAAMLEEIKKIREAPVTEAELSRAKDSYLNGYAFEFDSTAKVVNRLATYELYGYPADFNTTLRDHIEKVTKDDVLRVAKKYLDPQGMVILAIGKADQFDKPLSTFGKVNTIDITIPEPKPKETVAEATPESLARGKALLLKVAKTSGENALAGLKDVSSDGVTTATTPMGQMEIKGKTLFVLPDRLHNEMTMPMGTMVQVLDGDSGWMVMGPNSRDLPGSAVAEMKQGLFTGAGCALLLRNALVGKLEANAVGEVKFEGKDAEDVIVRLGDKPTHVYISADSNEILGVKRTLQTQEGPAEVVEVYGAYQVVSGLRLPFEKTQKMNGEVKATTRVSSVKVNAGFDEALFKKPAAPPAR